MPRGFAGGLLLLREGASGVDGVIDSRTTGFFGTGSLVRRGLAVGALRSTVREADATGEGDATTDPLSPLFSVVAVTATPRTSAASSKPLNGAWTQRVLSCCGNGHDPRECVVQPLSTKADSSKTTPGLPSAQPVRVDDGFETGRINVALQRLVGAF